MAYLMMVDDDEDFASATAKVLKDAGHEVAVQLVPEEALEEMKKRCPDLVILDVMFPEDSSAGLAMARRMRQQTEAVKTVPILMMTAVNQKFPVGLSPKDIDEDWLPVSDFLEKPPDFDVLLGKVDLLLKQASSA